MHYNGVGQVKFSGVPALPPLCQPGAQSQRGKSVEKFDCHSQFAPFALIDLSKLDERIVLVTLMKRGENPWLGQILSVLSV